MDKLLQPGMLVQPGFPCLLKMGNRKGAYYFFQVNLTNSCKTLVLTRLLQYTLPDPQFDLDQRLADIFCEGSDIKYFSLCSPYSICCVFSPAIVVKSSHRQYRNQLNFVTTVGGRFGLQAIL